MNRKLNLILIALFLFVAAACNSEHPGYKKKSSGLYYAIHESNSGPKAQLGQILQMDMSYRFPEDSVIFRNTDYDAPIFLKLQESEYKGDIYEALGLLAQNDSASFVFEAESFFLVTLRSGQMPPFIGPKDKIFVDIRLHKIFTEEEFDAYQAEEQEAFVQQQELAFAKEDQDLKAYLKANNINTPAQESGLIIIEKTKGRGAKPQAGQMVKVHYRGTLLDGTVFDSSFERNQPIEFQLGTQQVIRGWDEGISKLQVGSKATLIVPSYLAYGDQQRGAHIKPFSTLIFDIELVDAK